MKRLLIWILCICMAATCTAISFAEEEDPAPAGERQSSRDADPVDPLIGDANGDGRGSASDASFVLRYCVGLSGASSVRQLLNADVNCDGTVDAGDASMILRHAARLTALHTPDPNDALFSQLMNNSYFGSSYTEWIARFIRALPNGNRKNVLCAGATYIGTPYSELDCSLFVATAYEDAGIDKKVYPGSSGRHSNGVLTEFGNRGQLRPASFDEDTGALYADGIQPGCVLIYINPSTNKGDHLALYVGQINGWDVIMDSGNDGVRLRTVWSEGKWQLTYYIDPLA